LIPKLKQAWKAGSTRPTLIAATNVNVKKKKTRKEEREGSKGGSWWEICVGVPWVGARRHWCESAHCGALGGCVPREGEKGEQALEAGGVPHSRTMALRRGTKQAEEIRRNSYWSGARPEPPRRASTRERKVLSERRGSKWKGRFQVMAGQKNTLPLESFGGWITRTAADGTIFYQNEDTSEVTWVKPSELMTAREKAEEESEWTWVPDPKIMWQPAQIKSRDASGDVTVRTLDNKAVRVPHIRMMKGKLTDGVSQKVPMWPLKRRWLDQIEEDLVALPALDEGMILHNLRIRYESNDIYTWVGSGRTVLISFNPFQELPLYTDEQIDLQRNRVEAGLGANVPPHVYGIANDSLEQLLHENRSQSILVSGESGAGKTHATRTCLDFLAKVAGSSSGRGTGMGTRFEMMMTASSGTGPEQKVEQKILVANPVLEAFGNAKTVRNNNSSRFGKWIAVYFDTHSRAINGAQITSFLLESSRVAIQSKNERNYHIFYQMLSSDDVRERYMLMKEPLQYHYLNQSGSVTAKNMNDEEEFASVVSAMEQLEFEEEEQEWLFRTTAAVLHLGNIDFTEIKLPNGQKGCRLKGDSSPVGEKDSAQAPGEDVAERNPSTVDGKPPAWLALEYAAELLEIQGQQLEQVLTKRSIVVRGETSVIPLKKKQATQARDSLAKAIYARLFDWLVRRINESFGDAKGKFIGILDIFGFEIFEHNSFEQLCINYANEKLQQLFNQHTFGDEEELYEIEKINFKKIGFQDNQPVLDLIDKRPDGILNLLDDECVVPGGSDERLMGRIEGIYRENPFFKSLGSASSKNTAVKRADGEEIAFSIKHFAGIVVYDMTGFLAKNADTLFQDLYDICAKSNDVLTQELFPQLEEDERVKVISQSAKFRNQLNELMAILRKTECRYIRCIKPNSGQEANNFDGRKCLEQLSASGVFEAVEIRKTGFPFRLFHEEFVAKYRCINVGYRYHSKGETANELKGLCREILDASPQKFAGVQIGETRVLYRVDDHKMLELLRNLALATVVPKIQLVWRMALGRKFRKNLLKAEKALRVAMEAEDPDIVALGTAVEEVPTTLGSVGVIFRVNPPSLKDAQVLFQGLERWESVEEELEEFEDLKESSDDGFDRDKAQAIMDDADRLRKEENAPMTERQKELYDHLKSLLLGKDVEESIRGEAEAAIEEPTKEKVMSVHEEARQYAKPNEIIATLQILAARYERVDKDVVRAVEMLDRPLLQEIVEEATDLNYITDPVQEAQRLLELPEKEFVEKEIEAAKKHKNKKRRVHRELRLRELALAECFDQYENFFSNEAIRGNHSTGVCTLIFTSFKKRVNRPGASNATLRQISTQYRREGGAEGDEGQLTPVRGEPPMRGRYAHLHRFTETLDTSVLNIKEKDTVNDALVIFKHIRRYMDQIEDAGLSTGSRNFSGFAVVNMGFSQEELRDEIFAQIVKQLTYNPSRGSILAGIDLLCLCIAAFPPNFEPMENYLTVWVKLHLPNDFYRTFVSCVHEHRFASNPDTFEDRINELIELDWRTAQRAESRESSREVGKLNEDEMNFIKAKHALANLRRRFKGYTKGSRWSLRHDYEKDPWHKAKRYLKKVNYIVDSSYSVQNLVGFGHSS